MKFLSHKNSISNKTQSSLWEISYAEYLTPALLTCISLGVCAPLGEKPITLRSWLNNTSLPEESSLTLLPVLAYTQMMRVTPYGLEKGAFLNAITNSPWTAMFARRSLEDALYKRMKGEFLNTSPTKCQYFWKQIYSSKERANRFLLSMHAHTHLCVEPLIELMSQHRIDRLVDVGSGLGTIGAAFAKRFPSKSATLLDLPGCVSLVKNNSMQGNTGSNLTIISADIRRDDWSTNSDLYLLSHVLQDHAKFERSKILYKAVKAMARDSMLWVHGIFPNYIKPKPLPAAFSFYLNCKLGGRLLTQEEQVSECKEVGLKFIKSTNTLGYQKVLMFKKA